jgi:hypothetical protein
MKYRFVFILLTGFFAACNHELGYIPDSSVSVGLFTPVQLNHDTTVIYLSDFFPEPGIIDSIDIIGVDHSSWSESSHELTIVSSDKMPVISELRIWVAQDPYSVLMVGQDAKKDIPVLYTHTYERCEIKSCLIPGLININLLSMGNG